MRPMLALSQAIDRLNEKIGTICNLLVLIALGLVALLALLTIIGMIKGARLKNARRAAEKEEQARIDALRDKIECFEDPAFTSDYHDPEKRSIANGMTVTLKDWDDRALWSTRLEPKVG